MKQPQSVASSGARSGGGVDISGDSAELIAFSLLRSIAGVERQRIGEVVESKDWILNTYAECLAATRGERTLAAKPPAAAVVVKSKRGATAQ